MIVIVGSVFRFTLHGFGTPDSGREWLLPVMLFAGSGTAALGKWLLRRGRHEPPEHDEPV